MGGWGGGAVIMSSIWLVLPTPCGSPCLELSAIAEWDLGMEVLDIAKANGWGQKSGLFREQNSCGTPQQQNYPWPWG